MTSDKQPNPRTDNSKDTLKPLEKWLVGVSVVFACIAVAILGFIGGGTEEREQMVQREQKVGREWYAYCYTGHEFMASFTGRVSHISQIGVVNWDGGSSSSLYNELTLESLLDDVYTEDILIDSLGEEVSGHCRAYDTLEEAAESVADLVRGRNWELSDSPPVVEDIRSDWQPSNEILEPVLMLRAERKAREKLAEEERAAERQRAIDAEMERARRAIEQQYHTPDEPD